MGFPPGFVWGAGTSAFQIEGGRTDGKGQSIWDTFSDEGRMGDRGDLACDHYHRWPEDVALMADLGLNAYRMSIAWTRVLPDGTGAVNQKGLDFYKRLIDAVIEAGMTPWVTLHHWDLPQTLQNQGGWASRETVGAFVKYTEIVAQALGNRVSHWVTQNEPWVAAILGYAEGVFAPGLRDWEAGILAGHHLLLSHGEAMAAIRSHSGDAKVGIALDCRPCRPASLRPEDIDAWTHFDGYRNRWFFDPVFGQGYPEDTLASYHDMGRISNTDWIHPGDLEVISSPVDFLGLNYYTSLVIKEGQEEGEHTGVATGPNPPPGFTEIGLAGHSRGFNRRSQAHPQGVLGRSDLHNRKRSFLFGRPRPGRCRSRRSSHRLCPRPPGGYRGRHRRRSSGRRLLPLELARQPRVGIGVLATIWPYPCRPRNPGPHAPKPASIGIAK